jgi:hypothetical protein
MCHQKQIIDGFRREITKTKEDREAFRARVEPIEVDAALFDADEEIPEANPLNNIYRHEIHTFTSFVDLDQPIS